LKKAICRFNKKGLKQVILFAWLWLKSKKLLSSIYKYLTKLHLLTTYRFLECRSFFLLFFKINFSKICVSVLNHGYPGVCVFFCIAYAKHDSFQVRHSALKEPCREGLKAYKLFNCICVVHTLPDALACWHGVIFYCKCCSSRIQMLVR